MIDSLLLEWIPEGGLPIYRVEGQAYYQFCKGRWERRLTGRVLVSTDVDAVFPDFEGLLRNWLAALEDLAEFAGTVIFAIQAACELNDVRLVIAGMAFVEGTLPTAVPLNGASADQLIVQACRGLAGEDSNELHPALRGALERELAHRAEREAIRRQDREAEARSLQLLESHLAEDQLTEFRTQGIFHVGLRDGRIFRFCKRFGHNVHLMEEGACTVEYCIITIERVPLYDQMLAQKVLLEALPEEFFRIANRRTLPRPTIDPPQFPLAEYANALAQV